MNENIIKEAVAHAAECYPNESCGLVVQLGRKSSYVRVPNDHPTPREHFLISAANMETVRANAPTIGNIIRVIHSHPDCAGAVISDHDEATMNEIEIPFGIVNYPFTEYNEYFPFAVPLIGRPFVLGSQDCYGLIMDWHKLHDIHLPDFRLPYEWWTDAEGTNLYEDNLDECGFDKVDDMRAGDMVVFRIQADRPNHAGILMPDGMLLHHLFGQLSCRDFFGSYFRDRVVFVARHRQLPEVISTWL